VDEVEKMTGRIDDDSPRPLVRRVGHDLAGEEGINPSLQVPRHHINAGAGRPAYAGGKYQQHSTRYAPHNPHLPARKNPEPDFHKDILHQNGSNEYRPVP